VSDEAAAAPRQLRREAGGRDPRRRAGEDGVGARDGVHRGEDVPLRRDRLEGVLLDVRRVAQGVTEGRLRLDALADDRRLLGDEALRTQIAEALLDPLQPGL
jgi:hypothetical protein